MGGVGRDGGDVGCVVSRDVVGLCVGMVRSGGVVCRDVVEWWACVSRVTVRVFMMKAPERLVCVVLCCRPEV